MTAGEHTIVVLTALAESMPVVRRAARFAERTGGALTVAVVVPWPVTLHWLATDACFSDFFVDYETAAMMELAVELRSLTVPWDAVAMRSVAGDLPRMVRENGTRTVFWPMASTRHWLPSRWADRFRLAAVRRKVDADVRTEWTRPEDEPRLHQRGGRRSEETTLASDL
jgi:hypothetical protein